MFLLYSTPLSSVITNSYWTLTDKYVFFYSEIKEKNIVFVFWGVYIVMHVRNLQVKIGSELVERNYELLNVTVWLFGKTIRE